MFTFIRLDEQQSLMDYAILGNDALRIARKLYSWVFCDASSPNRYMTLSFLLFFIESFNVIKNKSFQCCNYLVTRHSTCPNGEGIFVCKKGFILSSRTFPSIFYIEIIASVAPMSAHCNACHALLVPSLCMCSANLSYLLDTSIVCCFFMIFFLKFKCFLVFQF